MQKIIGSILIVLSASALGMIKGQELQKRLSDMLEIKRIFIILKSQIEYTRSTFPAVFGQMARRCDGIYKEWLLYLAKELNKCQANRIRNIWEDGVDEVLFKTQLKKTELELIKSVGTNLGQLDIESQTNAICLFLEQWEETIQKTRADLDAKKRLSNLLGVLGGAFLVILLV